MPRNYFPTLLHHHIQPEPLIQERMDLCFHVVYSRFWSVVTDCLGRIQHLVNLNALIYTSVVTIGYLSYCCLQQEPTKHFHLDLPLTEYFCFSAPFSVNLKRCRECYAGKFHVIPINDHVTQHHSFLILMRCLNFSRCRDHVCMHKCVESFPCDLLIRYSCINSQVYLTK